jgi:hypothetical protein
MDARRQKKWIALIVAVALVGIVVTVGLVMWRNRGPSRASVVDAVKDFRSDGSTTRGAAKLRPAPGVYIYAGSGEEKLSFLDTHQSQAGRLPGTVRRTANDCWTFEIQYNSFHRQTWRRCVVDGRLVETGGSVEQKFDFGALSRSEHSTVSCRPAFVLYDPTSHPGHREPVQCVGRSETTGAEMLQQGEVRFVGPAVVRIDGQRIPSLHFVQDITFTGGQSGSAHEEIWIAAADGLPLREVRSMTVVSPAPAPLYNVTYSEHGSWRLTSMTPKR